MKAYLLMFKIESMMVLQYRVQALAGVFTQFFFGFMRVFVMVAFFASNNRNQPMTLPQVVTYIWMTQMFLTLIAWRPDPETKTMIKEGTLAYQMVRPLRLSLAWLMRSLARRGLMPIMRGIPILIIALLLPKPYNFVVEITPNRYLLILTAIICAWLLAGVLNNLLNILAIYLMSTDGLATLFPIIMLFFSGLILPIPLFPEYLQKFFFYTPFIGVMDTPSRIIMGHMNIGLSIKSILVQLFWIILIAGLNDILLEHRLKNVSIQGG